MKSVIRLLGIRFMVLVVGWLAGTVFSAQLTVASNADSGPGSLRQAIADAQPGDTIVFDSSLNDSVITLTSGQLDLDKPLTILGPGPDQLAIDGNASSRVFNIEKDFYPSTGTYHYWISGLTITNGLASSDRGGGIRSLSGNYQWIFKLTISNCVIRANSTTASGGDGGGVYSGRFTLLSLIDSDVSGNQAAGDGGGLWTGDTALIERSLFSGNTTATSGGGVFVNEHGTTVVRNCTVSGNTSTYTDWNTDYNGGGGFYCKMPALDIVNTTISGNYAKRGGGVRVQDSRSIVSLQSTLISGNSDDLDFPDVLGTFVAVTNCLVSVTNGVVLPGANNIFDLPAPLEPLADNGGPTRTHALPRKSPAIDKGSNPLALATDQRGDGFPRMLGAAVDIGAYEFMPPPAATLISIQ